ncbi:MAG: GGDEF domain-containing protein [Candidatus Omnitrophota bacterium]|nr:GGDEF domain-containing protein [Candidatus Omnitrophota bacterium]
MSFLKGLLWFLFFVVLLAVSMYMTGNFALSDYLTQMFLEFQPYLPMELNFDQFLVVVTVMSLIVVVIIVSGCAGLLVYMGARLSVAQQKQGGQAAAAKREISHIQEQHARQYDQLILLGQTLTKRLDKRVLVQGIVESASRNTSVGQASSVVSLWLLNFGTDTMQFEIGHYCDESFFQKTDSQLSELPFSRVAQEKKTWLLATGREQLSLVKPEKMAPLAAVSGTMVIPLVVENTVLGVLLVFCHPDILKSYTEQQAFYHALWEELALALAVAVQGELAIIDRLTGVHNREYFLRRLSQELDRATRYQFPLSLLMVDIDNFKAVNDMLGHPQGDAVLRIISKIVKKEVRAIDLVGRYGGEEFIILLPETGFGDDPMSAATGALLVAERIRKGVDDEFHGLQKPLNLGVSIGLCVRRMPEDRTMDQRELIRLADEQLYRAKATGKNKVCVYRPEAAQTTPDAPHA